MSATRAVRAIECPVLTVKTRNVGFPVENALRFAVAQGAVHVPVEVPGDASRHRVFGRRTAVGDSRAFRAYLATCVPGTPADHLAPTQTSHVVTPVSGVVVHLARIRRTVPSRLLVFVVVGAVSATVAVHPAFPVVVTVPEFCVSGVLDVAHPVRFGRVSEKSVNNFRFRAERV